MSNDCNTNTSKIEIKSINDFINKNKNNHNNHIIIGLNETQFINQYIYERVLIFLQQKQPNAQSNYKSYSIYTHNNIHLHVTNNGSSNCYSNIQRYNKTYTADTYNIVFKSYSHRKLTNDIFESNYSYDNIDHIESVSYTYNNIIIDLMKVNNKYVIKLIIENDISSITILNLINTLVNIV